MYNFPDIKILTQHLSDMPGIKDRPVEIISRANFIESSTFPVEIVTCKTKDGKTYSLFCKYLAGMGANNFGHRGGVEYEAKIYELILDKAPVSKIKFFGQCRLNENGDLLLVIEYLGESLRMLYSSDPDAIIKAAEWIGNFHKIQEVNAPSFVTVYDKAYYLIWSERFRNLTKALHEKFPWLISLANYYEINVDSLLSCNQTIIHGEFYPKNILLKEGIIYVVDWESAAIAPGEIDLASLIEGWDNDMIHKIKSAYKKARWPEENFSKDEFEKRILLTQIYFHFWWWEEKGDAAGMEDTKPIKKLLHLSKEAGLV
jgi:hypothetical protein